MATWQVPEATGSAYASPDRLNAYRAALKAYMAANPAIGDPYETWQQSNPQQQQQLSPAELASGSSWSGSPQANPYDLGGFTVQQLEQMGSATNQQREEQQFQDRYQAMADEAFKAQLSPSQRAEYEQLRNAQWSKGNATQKGGFGAALAAMGGLGALQSGALSGATGGAGLGGLDAATVYGPGSGWGADLIGGGVGAGGAAGGAAGAGAMNGLDAYLTGLGGADGSLVGGLGGAAGASGAAGGGMGLSDILKALTGAGSGLGGGGANWLNLLGNLGGGLINSYTSGKATDALVQGGKDANALLREMWTTARNDQAPYREAGTSALAGIQALLKDPSSVANLPDYQFGLNQGTKALQNSATGRGMTYSGQQAKALQKYGNDYAGSKLNESYNRLAGVAGIGQQATNQTGALGANYANQLANNITGMGNATGSGYIGQGNAWNSAIGGALNGFSEQALIDAIRKAGGG